MIWIDSSFAVEWLADSLLAATASMDNDPIASFDRDFVSLGFRERGGLWIPF